MDEQILTVSELTHAIKEKLEFSFPAIRLQGEISNCTLHSSGHLYFSLKDAQAQIGAVMFKSHVKRLITQPKNGDRVVVTGSISVYPPSGRYQIVVYALEQAGIGALLLKLEALKRELLRRGWFAKERKRPLPQFPKRIGVVTSPTGAAIQDILNILSRRAETFHLILNPVRVQGEGAAQEICRAIEQFNRYNLVDLIIVGRGGGSIEDLFAFNEECVAEAIVNSTIPIIAAVGHETDHTIAEYVADRRAPTPSAAAEIAVGERAELVRRLERNRQRLQQTLSHLIRAQRHRLDALRRQPLFSSPYTLLGPWMQRLDEMGQQLEQTVSSKLMVARQRYATNKRLAYSLNPAAQIAQYRQRLIQIGRALDQSIERLQKLRMERLKQLANGLKAINPKNLLAKGYTILFSEKKEWVINSVEALKTGAAVRLILSDGEALATIDKIEKDDRARDPLI